MLNIHGSINVAMGKQQKMQSFYKRKRDEEVGEHTSVPDSLAMVVFVIQRDEDGQENHMQDEEQQENPISQEEEQQARKSYAYSLFFGEFAPSFV